MTSGFAGFFLTILFILSTLPSSSCPSPPFSLYARC
jgi:hypothetical protein